MHVGVLAALAMMLAGCTTPEMAGTTMSAGEQQTTAQREAPVPPALRAPRQRSGVGWPDIGYRPYGR
jgi:hypothetical protein